MTSRGWRQGEPCAYLGIYIRRLGLSKNQENGRAVDMPRDTLVTQAYFDAEGGEMV